MTENNFLGEQFLNLWKENEELRLKIAHDKQRKKEYKQKLENFQVLVNDASVKLNEGSDLIKKLQQNLKLCQEKLSEKTKALVAKDDTIHEYQLHISNLNDLIKQLYREKTFEINQKIDVGIQTSPTQRRYVRFNLDKENCSIDPKYFQTSK